MIDFFDVTDSYLYELSAIAAILNVDQSTLTIRDTVSGDCVFVNDRYVAEMDTDLLEKIDIYNEWVSIGRNGDFNEYLKDKLDY